MHEDDDRTGDEEGDPCLEIQVRPFQVGSLYHPAQLVADRGVSLADKILQGVFFPPHRFVRQDGIKALGCLGPIDGYQRSHRFGRGIDLAVEFFDLKESAQIFLEDGVIVFLVFRDGQNAFDEFVIPPPGVINVQRAS